MGSQLQHFGRGGRGRVRSGRSCPVDEHLVDIPVRYALFVQVDEAVYTVIDGILETEIVSKRFWLLEGRFCLPDLYFWANCIDAGRRAHIDAELSVIVLSRDQWPAIEFYLAARLRELTQDQHEGLAVALGLVQHGHVLRGERLISSLMGDSDSETDSDFDQEGH